MRIGTVCGAAVLAALVANCSNVKPDTADTSKPAVAIKVKNADNQYVPATDVTMPAGSASQLVVMCTAEDNGGISFISLSFGHAVDSCTVNSAFYSGSFPIASMPPDQAETVQPDAQGQVPTNRFFMAMPSGPFGCNVPGQGAGAPIGTTVKAVCTGRNWSSNPNAKSASATLNIHLK